MKNIAKLYLVLGLSANFLVLFAGSVLAQDSQKSAQELAEEACVAQKISGTRTYKFRELPLPTGEKGWFGPKPWHHSITRFLPFFRPSKEKYAADDIRVLQETYGKPAPVGESARARKIRLAEEEKVRAADEMGETRWQLWQTENPNATELERKAAEVRVRIGTSSVKSARFDWSDYSLNLGEVKDQGFSCNLCWAFAAVDAAQSARHLSAFRNGQTEIETTYQPSVRQLVSCMKPGERPVCKEGWHGDVLTYLVESGLPLGGSNKYSATDTDGWECDAPLRVKALTWDYVSATPQQMASTEEIKNALVKYGPVLTVIRLDLCFGLYGEGIFNEEMRSGGNHIMLIVGWNDEKQAWRVKNSFGEEWGESGYGWIKYGSNEIGRFSAVLVANPEEEVRLAAEIKKLPKEESR